MTTIGKGFVAVLSTDQRAPVERRPAKTWAEGFAEAHGCYSKRKSNLTGASEVSTYSLPTPQIS